MGGNHEEDDEEETKEDTENFREMSVYNTAEPAFSLLFSKRSPPSFAKRLKNLLGKQDVEAKIDTKRWLFSFDATQELDDYQIDAGFAPKTCKVRVELLKIPGSQLIAVKFNRVKGDICWFNEWFDVMKMRL